MLQLSLAGRAGRDAEHKQTQGGNDLCSFSIAADVGFGDNKQTIWVDVTKWGKGTSSLAGYIRKGTPVAVSGEMSLREHNGKTYVQCRADVVTLLGKAEGGRQHEPADDLPGSTELDDDIPF